MKQEHIILRAFGPAGGPGGFLGGGPGALPAAGPGTGKVAVEMEMLSAGDAAAVARKNDVAAVAPVMPMHLVEPLDEGLAAAAGPDWGVQAVGAVSSPFTGSGIVVAVLDTGIDSTHPAFAGVNLVTKSFTGSATADDDHGHGTHCAGTIFGRDVDGVRIGVARGVSKALIGKVLGPGGGGSDQIVKAIQWAVGEGANVISMSLGMDFPGFQKQLMAGGMPQEVATSRALEGYRLNVQLFEKLAAMVLALSDFMQTTLLIAAAGNESRTNVNPDFKIAVAPPAVSDGMISVAALGQSAAGFTVAPFSNSGALISGPGVAITSAKRGGGLVSMSGTSMATPNVAGVAALWAQKLKTIGPLNSRLLTSRLLASGTLVGLAPGFDPGDVGGGLVQAPQN
ncbi:MAG: S8 family serine peptidase [Acidobacteriota bacterium]